VSDSPAGRSFRPQSGNGIDEQDQSSATYRQADGDEMARVKWSFIKNKLI